MLSLLEWIKKRCLIKQINIEIKSTIPAHYPGNEIRSLKDYFKISLTYTSNAIEGNTLTESETKVLIEDGLTVGGKPVKDYTRLPGML